MANERETSDRANSDLRIIFTKIFKADESWHPYRLQLTCTGKTPTLREMIKDLCLAYRDWIFQKGCYTQPRRTSGNHRHG